MDAGIASQAVEGIRVRSCGSADEFAGGPVLRGDEHYHLVTFSTRSYFRTVGKFVLSLSGKVGFLNQSLLYSASQ